MSLILKNGDETIEIIKRDWLSRVIFYYYFLHEYHRRSIRITYCIYFMHIYNRTSSTHNAHTTHTQRTHTTHTTYLIIPPSTYLNRNTYSVSNANKCIKHIPKEPQYKNKSKYKIQTIKLLPEIEIMVKTLQPKSSSGSSPAKLINKGTMKTMPNKGTVVKSTSSVIGLAKVLKKRDKPALATAQEVCNDVSEPCAPYRQPCSEWKICPCFFCVSCEKDHSLKECWATDRFELPDGSILEPKRYCEDCYDQGFTNTLCCGVYLADDDNSNIGTLVNGEFICPWCVEAA